MIQAVVFDLDGVMINSEVLSFKAWQDILKPYGIELTEVDYARIIGMDLETSNRFMLETTGIPLDMPALQQEMAQTFMAYVENELEPMPGLEELVAALVERNIPIAVASNSPGDYVLYTLELIGIRDKLQAVVAREQVALGKPAPDVYLEAASQLVVSPGNCLAVEDTPIGLQAALAAGMVSVAVAAEAPWEAGFKDAHARFRSLVELRESLDSLLVGNHSNGADLR